MTAKTKDEAAEQPATVGVKAPAFDPAAVARRQRELLAKIEITREEADKGPANQWYGDPLERWPELREWHFFRCGLKSDERAKAIAWDLRQAGWTPAPPGMRCRGYEADGDKMLAMCATPETFGRTEERRRRRMARVNKRTAWNESIRELESITGTKVEVKGSTGMGSLDDYASAQAEARR